MSDAEVHTATGDRTFVQRMMGAAMLDISTYEEVEHDLDATGQAALVVIIVAICSAIGGLDNGNGGLIGRPIGELAGWVVWSGVTYLIGTRVFSGTATWGELLRTIGFAKAPGVLFLLGVVPLLGGLTSVAVGIWMLVTGLVAIRQALDVTTGQAIITALLGFLSYVAVAIAIALMFGLGAGVAEIFR